MKTADEWWDESCPTFEDGSQVIEWVKEIQLDAIKEGMKRAADLVRNGSWGHYSAPNPADVIWNAAEKVGEE